MSLTVCLLHWKRPENLRRILEHLATQTIRSTLFLWNNSGRSFEAPGIDWQIDSSTNRRCSPRWHMASQAETEFVCSLDDDLLPTDDRVFELVVEVARQQPADRLIGSHGFVLDADRPYVDRLRGVNCPEEDVAVDLVKGRCLLVRTESLRKTMRLGDFCGPFGQEDDLALCGRFAIGRPRYHLVSSVFHGRMQNLPEGNEALSADKVAHYQRREAARRYWSL